MLPARLPPMPRGWRQGAVGSVCVAGGRISSGCSMTLDDELSVLMPKADDAFSRTALRVYDMP
jgi:hypothetical protein